MRGRIRVAVVTVALVASAVAAGTAAADASSGLPSGAAAGKPLPTASDQAAPKPVPSKLTDAQLRKLKQQKVRRSGGHGLDDAQLADLARRVGVSKSRLISALITAKMAMIEKGSDPGDHLDAAIVKRFAHDLRISPARARKVLQFVVTAPDKAMPDKPKG